MTANITLEELRRNRSEFQLKLLDEFWKYFCQKNEWPVARVVYRDHGRLEVRKALSEFGSSIVREDKDSYGRGRFQLTLLGIILTSEGSKAEKWLLDYFRFQREVFLSDPERLQITHTEVQKALELSDEETKMLGQLIFFGSMFGGSGGHGDGTWTVSPMGEVEEWTDDTDIAAELHKWLLRNHGRPGWVFQDERHKEFMPVVTPQLSSPEQQWAFEGIFGPKSESKRDNTKVTQPNQPNRRYQVFVSSTYIDLLDERQQVMHALLESNCIPSGMELFPAANTSQWNLIKQVIDECDYYVVIVAGKYGSIGPDGISYTEMEYDYALSRGKPILGFFHSDIKKLPGDRLEDSDAARRKLAMFTEKVRQRICRSWKSPEGLASSLKTAISHAIQADPKPGWVRGGAVPTWDMVETLEKRIVELEEKNGD